MARQATGIMAAVALAIGAGGPLAFAAAGLAATADAATTASAAVTASTRPDSGGIRPPVPAAGCGSPETCTTAAPSRPAG